MEVSMDRNINNDPAVGIQKPQAKVKDTIPR